MNSLLQRYFAAVVGFGFVVVWSTIGVTSAILCVVGTAVFYGGAVVVQDRRLGRFTAEFMAANARNRREAQRRPRPKAQPVRELTEEPVLVADYGW